MKRLLFYNQSMIVLLPVNQEPILNTYDVVFLTSHYKLKLMMTFAFNEIWLLRSVTNNIQSNQFIWRHSDVDFVLHTWFIVMWKTSEFLNDFYMSPFYRIYHCETPQSISLLSLRRSSPIQ